LLVLAKPSSPTLASLAPVRDVYGDRTAAAIRPRRGRIGCIALDRRPFTATRSCRAPGAWRLARRPPNLAADVRSVRRGPVAAAKEGVDRGAGQTAEARPRTVLRWPGSRRLQGGHSPAPGRPASRRLRSCAGRRRATRPRDGDQRCVVRYLRSWSHHRRVCLVPDGFVVDVD